VPVAIPDALKPLLKRLDSLTPYPRNAQRHPPEDVEKFRAVLRKFGWTNPIVAWGKNGTTYISAGHLRYLAATAEGLTEVPVLVRSDWSEAEFRAYTLADNQWTKRAAYDVALLRDELVDLDSGAFDLTLTGFEKNEVYAMVHGKESKGVSFDGSLQYRVIVDATSEQNQTELIERFEQEGLTCRPLIS
jgi:ParB-like chromosome segregation protein Spo0J